VLETRSCTRGNLGFEFETAFKVNEFTVSNLNEYLVHCDSIKRM